MRTRKKQVLFALTVAIVRVFTGLIPSENINWREIAFVGNEGAGFGGMITSGQRAISIASEREDY